MTKPLVNKRSFTLVEVLVAMTVLLLLTLLLASMLSSMTTAWQQERARGERRTTARRTFDFMARDLSLAALPLNHSDTNNVQFVIDPQAPTLTNYLVPHAIFFQAPVATDAVSTTNQGNLAVIGYFVRWVNLEPCLCRPLINPSSPGYAVYSGPATSWLTATLLDLYASALSTKGYVGLIGENVLGLWAQALDTSGNPITRTSTGPSSTYALGAYDSRLGYSVVNGGVTNIYGPCALPAAVRVGIVVIDSGTARRLTAKVLPAAPTGDFFADIQTFTSSLPKPIAQGAETFTEVVLLPRIPQ